MNSTLLINITEMKRGKFYIYKGASRENATRFSSAKSVELPVNTSAIIVFMTKYGGKVYGPGDYYGSGAFTVTVNGSVIPWWKKPFINTPP